MASCRERPHAGRGSGPGRLAIGRLAVGPVVESGRAPVLSYLLRWPGHRIERNDMGEVILIRTMLRRPYGAVAPGEVQGGEAAVP